MNSRERIRRIIAGEPADRCGLWIGNPHPDTWPIYHAHFGTRTEEEVRVMLGDDFRWIPAGEYRHVDGINLFDTRGRTSHGAAGPFATARTLADIDNYDWPHQEYLDFSGTLQALQNAGDYYRASGMWTPFFHHVMELFGMDAYFMNMYDRPELVHEVTNRVCQFFYDANERFFAQANGLMDAFFFGNDFGTQLDLLLGPPQFDEFIMPWFRRFTEQGHRHGYQVILHSCGSIHKVIDRLIDAGVDCLHPLQALAANMDADTLARDFKGKLAFLGGIDTQRLLMYGTPDDVRRDVRRVKQLLGPQLIVSPSHEALLPNVPPQNVRAMAEEAIV